MFLYCVFLGKFRSRAELQIHFHTVVHGLGDIVTGTSRARGRPALEQSEGSALIIMGAI